MDGSERGATAPLDMSTVDHTVSGGEKNRLPAVVTPDFPGMLDETPVGVCLMTPAGGILYANATFARLLGHADAKAFSQSLNSAPDGGLPPEQEFLRDALSQFTQIGGASMEAETWCRSRDGRVFEGLLRWRMRPGRAGLGDDAVLLFLEDVSDRKRALRALRKEERKYRDLVENANSIIVRLDTGGRIMFFNEFAQRFFGYSEEQIIGRHVVGTILPERSTGGEELSDLPAKVLAEPEKYSFWENENMRRDGSRVWVTWANRLVTDERGGIVEILCVGSDVTQRRKAEQELHEQLRFEQFLADLSARFAVALIPDVNTELGQALHELADLIGADRCGFLEFGTPDGGVRELAHFCVDPARSEPDFFPAESYAAVGGLIADGHTAHLSGLPESLPDTAHAEREYCLRTGLRTYVAVPLNTGVRTGFALSLSTYGGDRVWRESLIPRLKVAGEILGNAIQRERTTEEYTRLRRDLEHVSRVSTLGQLAASLAHEINQPLAAILTNAEAGVRMLDRRAPDSDEFRAILADIAEDDRRAGQVIRRLRSLLRKGPEERAPVDLNAILREVVSFLHSELLDRKVRVSLCTAEALPAVLGDRIQLQQVLLNLLLNGAEAMADADTANRVLDVSTAYTADGVEVIVRDHGSGIRDEHGGHIFEPFFTTKEGGLGMGLAISQSIVEAHGGNLAAIPCAGGGAAFRVRLPARPDPAT